MFPLLRSVVCSVLRSVLVAAGVLNSVFALAQLQPAPPSGAGRNGAKYTVSGTVVNAVTGEPIRRALVRLAGPVSASGFTNESGRFRFDNIPEESAWIGAEKPTFLGETDTPKSNRSFRRTSSFSIGPNSKDLQIKLTPEARIEGRVTDSDGEPVEGVQVQATGERIIEGRKQSIGYSMATTTGTGHYLIGELAPGAYFIHTQLRPVFGSQRFGQPVEKNFPLVYPSRYFPDSADLASAQPQELKGGEDAEVNFTLTPKPTFRISGTVAGAQNYLNVSFGDSDAFPAHLQFDRRANRFIVSLVPPGSWTLRFSSQDMQGNQYSAREEVTVADSDIGGLQVALQPDSSIPVDIQRRTAGRPIASAQVRLIPKEIESQNRWYVATPRNGDSPGAMLIRNVPPGTYHLAARASGSACIESVTSGSANLLHDDLVVNGGAQPSPINVVLREDCGKLSGVVHSNAGAIPASVLLVSDSSMGDPIVIGTQPDGTFMDGLLSPGSYHVYAFSNLANLEYANPEALRDYSGQQISLEPNQPVTVNLDLIERKE